MLNATLKDVAGNDLFTVELPTTPRELKLSAYIDFVKVQESVINPVARAIMSISAITGVDYGEMLEAKVGDIYSASTNLDGCLSPIFAHIYNVVGKVSPVLRTESDCTFEYKGQQYIIPYIQQIALSGVDIMPDISVIEAIEILETKRIAEQLEKEDLTGSVLFSGYLRTMAVIARKEGELLPIEEAEKEKFLSERMKHFQDIDCQTAFDVAFFLTSSLRGLGQNQGIFFSLIYQNLTPVVEMHVYKPKRTNRQRSTVKKYITGSVIGQ